MQLILNYIAAGLILVGWGLFAWFGKTPVEGFITALGIALSAVAGTHAHGVLAKRLGVPSPSSAGTPSQPAGVAPSIAADAAA